MSAPAPIQYRSYKYLRRNLILLTLDYGLFGIGAGLISASAFVPDYIGKLTTDQAVIGLAGSIGILAWLLPQLVFAQLVSRRQNRHIFLAQAAVSRLLITLIGLVTISARPDQTGLLIAVFFIVTPLFYTFDGLATLTWTDMLGSSLTPGGRAIVFSVGQLIVAAGALIGREMLRYLLRPDGSPFPINYGSVFLVASAFMVTAGCCLALTRPEPRTEPRELGPSLRDYVPYLGRILRTDTKFVLFVVMRAFFDLSTMATPFFIGLGLSRLKLDSATLVGNALLITQFGTIFASVVIGWISAQFGPKLIIQFSGAARIAMPLLALLSIEAGPTALYACFFCFGIVNSTIAPGYFDWLINYAPESQRAIYMGLSNTISAVGNLSPFIGGFLLNQSGSYTALFLGAGALAAIGLLISTRLIEPRRTLKPVG